MKKRRRKRKSRTEIYRTRAVKIIAIAMARTSNLVPGGNPFGIGEWTLYVARGPERG